MDEKIGLAHVERTVALFLRTSSGVKRDEDFFGLVLWLASTSATSGISLNGGTSMGTLSHGIYYRTPYSVIRSYCLVSPIYSEKSGASSLNKSIKALDR